MTGTSTNPTARATAITTTKNNNLRVSCLVFAPPLTH